MELVPYNIKVSVNCPPDTNTPGYVEENKSKPKETQLICQGAGLYQPSEIATTLLHDGLQGKFLGSFGMDGWLSTNLCIGMAPSSLCDLLFQSSFLGVMRLVAFGYLHYFHHLIRQSHNKRQKAKKKYIENNHIFSLTFWIPHHCKRNKLCCQTQSISVDISVNLAAAICNSHQVFFLISNFSQFL